MGPGSRFAWPGRRGFMCRSFRNDNSEPHRPLKFGDAALLGGLDAFLEVLGGAQPRLFGEFVVGGGEHALGEAGAHRGAGREQAERRALGDLLRELHGGVADLILRHAFVGQPHPAGFLAGHPPAGVEDQLGIVLADQFGKRHRQTEAGVKAEFGEIRGEPRLGAGDAEIRRHREPEAAADGRAMDGGDDRLPGAEDPHGLDIEMADLAEARCRIGFLARLLRLPRRIVEIGAGAERLALRGENRGADFDVAIEFLQRVGDLVDQRDVEEIQRRPPDFDQADVADFFDADVCEVAHIDPRLK